MFTLKQTSTTSNARRGSLTTAHGTLETPFFMPIATRGAVKTLSTFDLERLGSPVLLSNTYHLYLRPGLEVLKAFGGLHRFISWDGTLLTDSGGYQVFSLAKTRKLMEEGVEFASHIDGSRHLLTPELSIQIQQVIGSDIVMVLDECTPAGAPLEYLEPSVSRTTRWAERSKQAFEAGLATSNNSGAKLFGIVQGGINIDLRRRHAQELQAIGFDGYAIGGLSVGEPFEDACRIVEELNEILPQDRPRYFMGGAQPHEIVEYVKRGIDMFDCVLPTRNARHGTLYRWVHADLSRPDFYETVHITNEKYKFDQTPLSICHPREGGPPVREAGDPVVSDTVSDELSRYTLGYLRHLFTVDEMLGQRLATMMNVKFYLDLMQKIRDDKQLFPR